MKKKILLACTLIVMTMWAVLIGCKGGSDGEPKNGCKCTVWRDGEKLGVNKIDKEELEDEFNATTCSQLQKTLMDDAEQEFYQYKFSCTAY